VWAERYDRPLEDFFDLQDEIADRIAAIIEPAIIKAESKRIRAKRPIDLAAWEFCVEGFDYVSNYTKEDNAIARERFELALARDPTYARAYSGIAYTHCHDFRFGYTEDLDDTRRAAFDAARRAILLDDTDSQGHIMLARAYLAAGDGESAVAEGRRAIELNPHDNDALVMTGTFMAVHTQVRPEEGVGLLESGLELNPLDPRNFNFMGNLSLAYLCLGEYDKAVHWGREATRRNPNFYESHVTLASALGYLGHGDEALGLLARFDDSALDSIRRRNIAHPKVMDCLLEGLRKAGLAD